MRISESIIKETKQMILELDLETGQTELFEVPIKKSAKWSKGSCKSTKTKINPKPLMNVKRDKFFKKIPAKLSIKRIRRNKGKS